MIYFVFSTMHSQGLQIAQILESVIGKERDVVLVQVTDLV